ncbi:MAG: 6-carboxytetrahydropterin synthase [Bdellovibrionia bacterium]
MNITYQFQFSAAHFYEQKKWSPQRNQEIFGACYTPYGHGHNYTVEVSFPATDELTRANANYQTAQKIVNLLDHQHLNFVIEEFKDTVPTTENIAHFLWQKMQTQCQLPPVRLRLFEMPTLWVELTHE